MFRGLCIAQCLRALNKPAPSEPRPRSPSSGKGEAVFGSFLPVAEFPEVLLVWSEVLAVPWSVALLPLWVEVEGVVAEFWSVVEVVLLLWLVEDCVVLGCELELALELLPLPVCAARHRLASRSGEASHIFFIPKNLQCFLRDNSF